MLHPNYSEPHVAPSVRDALHLPSLIGSFCLVVAIYLFLVVGSAVAVYQHDALTPLTTLADEIFPFPAASVNGELVPLSRIRAQVATLENYDAQHGQTVTRKEVQDVVVTQVVDRALYRQSLATHGIVVSQANIDMQMQSIENQAGGQAKLVDFLQEQYGPEMTLERFQDWIVADSLQEAAVQSQLLVHATVSHILISVPANATTIQVTTAQQKALQVRATITDPTTQFAGAAQEYSDDIASRSKGGMLGTTVRGEDISTYSQAFDDAIFTLPLDQVSQPVRSQYGWELVMVTARSGKINQSLDQYTAALRQSADLHMFLPAN
jgi:parvulin-like peptidyl-prolyl isomerase